MREVRRSWPHRDAESQVRRLPSDHPQPITAHDIQSRELLERISLDLLRLCSPLKQGVRLLGVTLSALTTAEIDRAPQLSLAL